MDSIRLKIAVSPRWACRLGFLIQGPQADFDVVGQVDFLL